MNLKLFKKEKLAHKSLVLCWDGNVIMPAIFYNNQSFNGFYKFTTFYHSNSKTVYSKTKLEEKHKIHNVLKWFLIEGPR